jgi:hypothetical protein
VHEAAAAAPLALHKAKLSCSKSDPISTMLPAAADNPLAAVECLEPFIAVEVFTCNTETQWRFSWVLVEAHFFGCLEFPFRSSSCWRSSGTIDRRFRKNNADDLDGRTIKTI